MELIRATLERLPCVKKIGVGKLSHDGPCSCSTDLSKIHFCGHPCPSCQYLCTEPFSHSGRHHTQHGNMKNSIIISSEENVDIGDHQYKRGERSTPECCDTYCVTCGRGHIHTVPCMPDRCNVNQPTFPGDSTSTTNKFYNDHRHSKVPFSDGNQVIAIDELKHEAYYELINFKDPCTENYQKAFQLCSAKCGSESHKTETDNEGMPVEQFCSLELWHEPVKDIPADQPHGQGYVSLGGHYFPNCNHKGGYGRYSTYLIIDRSGSMGSKSVKPSSPQIRGNNLFKKDKLDNCMGLVYETVMNFVSKRNEMCTEDVVNFVPFNTEGTVVLSDVSVSQPQILLASMLATFPYGGTIFRSGIQAAYQHLIQTIQNQSRFDDPVIRQPVFIILSDSCDFQKAQTITYLTEIMSAENEQGCGLIFHALGFGNQVDEEYLKEIATIGKGGYHKVQNGQSMQMINQLTQAFLTIAEKPDYHFGFINLES